MVVAAICMAAFVAYMGRNCLGVASTSVRADLGIDISQMAWVMSAFFWAYALAQVPAGWLAHRFGTRRALAGYAAVWSVPGSIWLATSGLSWLCRRGSDWLKPASFPARLG